MKAPHLRILPIAVISLAMITGTSAIAAGAAASTGHNAHGAATNSTRPEGHLTAPVTGTFTTKAGLGHFTGNFMPAKFTVTHGVLEATGLLKGVLIAANGVKLGAVHQTVTMPVDTSQGKAASAAGCSILNLKLGPLHLDLLGLVVHLNRVHLTITAIPGAGQLLGNLLCKIVNLLNGSGPLGQISALLNEVLSLL